MDRGKGDGEDEPRPSVGLVLKPRKNKQFKKKRKRAHSSISDEAGEGEVEANVLLLKEAQRLRDTLRRSGLPQGNRLRTLNQATLDDTNSAGNDVAGGLGKAFAAERSAHVEEERMSRYVDEKMRERFGDTELEAPIVDVAKQYEDALYAIPEHLRKETGPMYDPGEGLPASGVEEIELPESVRKRNEVATEKAKIRMMSRRNTDSNVFNREPEVAENMSANFLQHRRDWNQNIVDSGKASLESNTGKKYGVQGRENKRETATDALVVERFRKRWRK